jgi:hypothetical protein
MLSQPNPGTSRFGFSTAGLGPEPLPPAAQYARANEVLSGLFQSIFEIDTELFHIAHLLDRAQPSADGKVSIRFRRSRHKTVDGQAPVFVRWHRPPASRAWHSKVLPAASILRQAKRDGLFRATYSNVPPLLRDARSLMARRASLLQIMDLARRTMALNTGLASKQVRQAREAYKLREPQIEAARTQALEDHAKRVATRNAALVPSRS